jgi:DinB superfamily
MRPKCLLTAFLSPLAFAAVVLVVCSFPDKSAEAQSSQQAPPAQWQRPDETKPLEDKSVQGAPQQHEPTAAELSRDETPGKAVMRTFDFQEYEFRSAAEAMPADKWDYRPAPGLFKNEKPEFGPAEMRTFAEQVKHVACSNFAFVAELEGTKPPEACDKGGPSPAKTRAEVLTYLRDSFATLKKFLSAITIKNMFDPIEGPYAGPNTRLGLAGICIWHAADHYGQMIIYLRLNGIVPPASRSNPPKLQDKY